MPAAAPRVAVVGPLSGPRAAWGALLTDAIAGQPHAAVRWELFDDRGDVAGAVAAATAVAADGGFAAVVGHFNSSGARASIPVYWTAGLPVVLPLATAVGLTANAGAMALRLCPDDDGQAAAIAAACRERAYGRLDVVHDGSAYGVELAERLRGSAGGGLSVQVAVTWPPHPATVALCGAHRWAAALLRHHAGGGAVFLVDDCDVAEFAALAGAAASGAFVARMAGGPSGRVVAAIAAVAGALAKHPARRGRALLDAVRAEVADEFTSPAAGWQIVPVRPRRGRCDRAARYDVAVVGGGVVGRAAAAELAEAGARVALLDPASRSSASAVSGALIRAFEPGERERQLALRAFQLLWGQPVLAARYGFRRTGALVLLGSEHLDSAADGVADLRAGGLAAEVLTVEELARRWPQLRTDGVVGAVWEPGGGYAVAAVALAAFADRAVQGGAAVFRECAHAVRDDGTVVLSDGALRAEVALIATGCATPGLLGERWPGDRPARTRRIRYAIVAGGEELPTIVDLTTGLWGRPDGSDSFLVGRPVEEWDVPVAAGALLTAAEVNWIRAGVATRLPALANAKVLTARFGTDLYVSDGPVLGALPGTTRTVVAAGWSGGGFKTAPAAAERAAAAAARLVGTIAVRSA